MKSVKLFLLLFCLTGLILSSCKSESSKKSEDNASNEKEDEEMNNENLEQSLGNLKEGEVVDFRVLKDALPENLAGLDRTSHTGQKTAFMSFKMSNDQQFLNK